MTVSSVAVEQAVAPTAATLSGGCDTLRVGCLE